MLSQNCPSKKLLKCTLFLVWDGQDFSLWTHEAGKKQNKKEKNSHVRSILYFKVYNTDIRRSFFTLSTATNGIMENHKKNSAINHRNYLDRENRHQIGMMTVYTGQDYHRI